MNPGADWTDHEGAAEQLLKPPDGASSLPLPLPHVLLLGGLQAHSCPADEAAEKLREAVLSGTFRLSPAPAEADQVGLHVWSVEGGTQAQAEASNLIPGCKRSERPLEQAASDSSAPVHAWLTLACTAV